MISSLLKLIAQWIGGSAVGSAVSNTIINAGTLALLTPVAYWFIANANTVVLTVHVPPFFHLEYTAGHCAGFGIFAALVLKLTHYLSPPR